MSIFTCEKTPHLKFSTWHILDLILKCTIDMVKPNKRLHHTVPTKFLYSANITWWNFSFIGLKGGLGITCLHSRPYNWMKSPHLWESQWNRKEIKSSPWIRVNKIRVTVFRVRGKRTPSGLGKNCVSGVYERMWEDMLSDVISGAFSKIRRFRRNIIFQECAFDDRYISDKAQWTMFSLLASARFLHLHSPSATCCVLLSCTEFLTKMSWTTVAEHRFLFKHLKNKIV